MERKFQRFISCLFTILVVVFLFGCKQPTEPGTSTLSVPTNVTVKAHESKLNTVTVTWSTGNDVAQYYWIYYSTTNNTASLATPQETKYSSSLWNGTGTCDIVLNKSGTYYFWVKAADSYDSKSPTSAFSDVATYEFTLSELTRPTDVMVKAHESKLNTVTVTWSTGNDVAQYYWIYYSTTNNTASLTTPQETKYSSSLWNGTGTCDIVLNKSGTYYFWVKAANSYDSKSPTSAFSDVATYEFTLQSLSVPQNLKAEKDGEGKSYAGIKLSWNTTNAPYYHIYWSESNDSNTAKKLTTTSLPYNTIYENVYDLKKGTTYYFWVKSANGYSPADSDSAFSSVASFTYN